MWLLFNNSKTFKDVLDFYDRIYWPSAQTIGDKGFIKIYERADAAKTKSHIETMEQVHRHDKGSRTKGKKRNTKN